MTGPDPTFLDGNNRLVLLQDVPGGPTIVHQDEILPLHGDTLFHLSFSTARTESGTSTCGAPWTSSSITVDSVGGYALPEEGVPLGADGSLSYSRSVEGYQVQLGGSLTRATTRGASPARSRRSGPPRPRPTGCASSGR